jgi:hypothetical protein
VVRGLTKHGGASAAMASSPEPVEHAAMHGSVGFLHKNDVATRGVLTQWSLMTRMTPQWLATVVLLLRAVRSALKSGVRCVTPDFKAKPNAHSMCVQEQVSTHTGQKIDTK